MDFFIVRPGQNIFEVDLMALIRHYEGLYFQDVKPIASAEFVPSLDGDARVLPEIDKIEVHSRFLQSLKASSIFVVHELINNKLYKKHGAPQPYEGQRFQAELDRLWAAGAYRNLL